mgnify:CR=1 FL=1
MCAVGAWMIGAAALLGACTDGPRRLSLPSEDEIVAAFPQEGSSQKAQEPKAKPLMVTMTQPGGTIHTLQAINVSFNQPVQIPDPEAAPPLTISPPIKGTWRWLGQRTVSFMPHKKPAMATQYTVTVSKDLRSADGQTMEGDHTFTFSTPGLRVARYDPSWYSARLTKDDVLFVQFNLPVDKEQVTEALLLYGGAKQVPITITPTNKDKGGDKVPEGTAFFIKPTGGFQNGISYRMTIGRFLKPNSGSMTLGSDWSRSFQTYGPFKVQRARCGWGYCEPSSNWQMEFNNPVTAKDIQKCVSVSPPVKFKDPYGYRGSTSVTLRPANARPDTLYTITLSGRCKDNMGNALVNPGPHTIQVRPYRPTVTMNRGINFMEKAEPGQKLTFPITLLNTPDINLRMTRLTEEQLPSFLKGFGGWWGGDDFKNGITPQVSRPFGVKLRSNVKKTYGINLGEVLGKEQAGVVFLDVQSDAYDQTHSYHRKRYHKSLVQVTDIGLTAKYSPDSVLIWTTSLSKATPEAGVRVAMRTVDGELLWEGLTDKDGLARGPGLKTFGSKRPRVILANRGKELSFIDLENWNMQVMPYRFNLPYAWDAPAVALRGHIFTERGVYRPGESTHVKGYLRLDKGRTMEVLPVDRARVVVHDSQNNVVMDQEIAMTDLDGFDVEVPLPENASLGTWSIKATPVGMDGGFEGSAHGSFRVEAYRAPDFEVTMDPANNDVTMGESAEVTISGQYLFGAPMSNAKVSWSATRRETSFSPPGFDGFNFGNNEGRFWWYGYDERRSESAESGQGTLDATGLRKANFEVPALDTISGPQELLVEASVTDVNRQVVSGSTRVKLHPGQYYLGIKRPGYLVEAGKKMDLKLVAVTPKGKTVSGQSVEVDLAKRTWTSVRKTMAGGGTTWVSEAKDKVVANCKVRTAARAVSCPMAVNDPGYYVIKARSKDNKGRTIESNTSVYVWGGGWSWWGKSDDERIDLVVDKAKYKVGDKARVMVKSPFRKARALVTVERRGILEQKTVELRGSASTIEVPITEAMLPNAYISVVLIRGREDKPKNDDGTTIDPGKPAFKLGYASINVDRGEKVLSVSVESARKTYQPGEQAEATITVRDHEGNPVSAEVTFMAVDEGVLSLTAYKTPNPIADFYRKQSIAVITSESRMAVVAKVDAANEDGEKGDEGGGGGPGGQSENYRSAFATTAAFMPTLKTDTNGQAKVNFKLPDNLTAFRLMAVAASTSNRFGSSDSRIQVQKPLMLRPALSRFASTGDTFEVRAVVQAVGESAGQVEVSAEASGPVELTGSATSVVTLGKGEIKEVVFPAVVGAPGEATFRFKARAIDGFEAEDAVEMKIPVRFPAVERSMTETGVIKARSGDEQARVFKRLALPEGIRTDVGGLEIELASSALAELLPGLDYLIGYPYGCVEQTTGRTLPLVALREMLGQDIDLPGISKEDVNRFAQSGVDRLLSMQTYNGGLGYWPGADQEHPWGSAYGGLALIKASRTEGLEVPPYKLNRLLNYLRSVVRGDASLRASWSAHSMPNIQAFAAYVLAVAEEPDISAHTVLFERRSSLSNFGKGLLAMAMARSGDDSSKPMIRRLMAAMLTNADVNGIEAHVHRDGDYYWELMDSDVRSDAIALMAIMASNPTDELSAKFARGLLAARKGGRWLSTQENAFAVLSLMEYFGKTESGTPDYTAVVGLGGKVLAEERFKKREMNPRRIFVPMQELVKLKDPVVAMLREGKNGPLYYNMKLSYAPKDPPSKPFDNGFTLRREYLVAEGSNAGQPTKGIKAGELVKVRLTVVAPRDSRYVVINDPLPAGLEPVNTRFATTAPSLANAVKEDNEDDWDSWDWWYGYHNFDHIEQRDDRVLLFADFLPSGIYTHTYLARATTLGDFATPAAFVEEMYNPEVFGRTEAFEFEVK